VLGPKFKDHADAQDDVFEIAVVKGFSLPLVLLGLAFPKVTGEFGRAVLPASANSHALI